MSSEPIIFIVGNSRSGTTMLMRVFNRNQQVHAINETHFFERLWEPSDSERYLSREEAEELLMKLISRQRDGFFAEPNEAYRAECHSLAQSLHVLDLSSMDVYRTFLKHEVRGAGKTIACEKTPQHVFYIREILRCFPQARVINMVRDPRSVLASQKNKWRRKNLGSSSMPASEVARLKSNYHPITMSQLWNSAVGAADAFENHPRVTTLRYEDLLNHPETSLKELCSFCEIAYEEDMLNIPVASSSIRADRAEVRGIDNRHTMAWKEHLTENEVRIVQRWCGKAMKRHGYEPVKVESASLPYIASMLSYPWKIAVALIKNRSRLRSLPTAISRRLAHQYSLKMKLS